MVFCQQGEAYVLRTGVLGVLCVVGLLACGRGPDARSVIGTGVSALTRHALTDLYPLRSNMRATYALAQTRSDGQVVQRTMLMDVVDVVREASGDTLATTVRAYGDFRLPATRVRVSKDNVRVSRAKDPEPGPSLVLLQSPLVVGRTWEGRQFADGSSESVQYRGVEPVDGPDGVVRAHRVDHLIEYAQGGSDCLEYWYAPGWGAVRMVERSTLFTNKGRIHLTVVGVLKGLTTHDGSFQSPSAAYSSPTWLPGGWFTDR